MGFEIWFALTPQYAGKILFVKKGHRLSLQYHEKKDEVLYISSGRIRMEMERDNKDMESFILDAGQCVRIMPRTKHRLTRCQSD